MNSAGNYLESGVILESSLSALFCDVVKNADGDPPLLGRLVLTLLTVKERARSGRIDEPQMLF